VVRPLIVALAFVEGWSVLTLEIVAGQMLTAGLGDSIDKWMWVLITSMVGLTVGYAAAHRFAHGDRLERRAAQFLVFGLCYLATTPLWCDETLSWLMGDTGHLSVAMASASIVLVPMTLFGMVPGLLVAASARGNSSERVHSGIVFAASTIGGMLGGLSSGLIVIPALGVTYTIRCVTGVMLLLPLLILLRNNRRRLAFCVAVFWIAITCVPRTPDIVNRRKVLHYEEGILGQVAVVEAPYKAGSVIRTLFVNRTNQTTVVVGTPVQELAFTYYLKDSAPVLLSYPAGSEALLLGLGGGSVAKLMRKLDFKVTVVELDPRIQRVAQTYFSVPNDAEYVVDDARRYIRRSTRSFDIIFFDMYRGEFPPSHVITTESLREVQRVLKPGGVVLLNAFGRIDSKDSEMVRSMVKTFRTMGFRCRAIYNTLSMNTVLVADRGDRDLVPASTARAAEYGVEPSPQFFDEQGISYDRAYVFTDDRPTLEFVYRDDARKLRRQMNLGYYRRRKYEVVPLYR
jgi:spermidine synthase